MIGDLSSTKIGDLNIYKYVICSNGSIDPILSWIAVDDIISNRCMAKLVIFVRDISTPRLHQPDANAFGGPCYRHV